MKILSAMYIWKRKSLLNSESHPDLPWRRHLYDSALSGYVLIYSLDGSSSKEPTVIIVVQRLFVLNRQYAITAFCSKAMGTVYRTEPFRIWQYKGISVNMMEVIIQLIQHSSLVYLRLYTTVSVGYADNAYRLLMRHFIIVCRIYQ